MIPIGIGSSFRSIDAWSTYHLCNAVVQEAWNTYAPWRPLVRFAAKQKILKNKLKVWSREVFGNIHQAIKNAKDLINEKDLPLEQSATNINKMKLCKAQRMLNEKLESRKASGDKRPR